jgi:Nucleotidyl transferase AbiEii toxin, Type IV TA system
LNPAEQFLALVAERRALAFGEAATQRGVSAVLLEKDFWVCWLLGVLFSDPDVAPHLVFKGGTSLSKVFGAIDRFSEDVDVSVSPAFVGADAAAFEALTSRTRRDAAVADMQRLCSAKVHDVIAPRLEAALRNALGLPKGSGAWLTFDVDPQDQSPNLYFGYPAGETLRISYTRRSVKLELGSLTDQQPVGRHTVRPWVAEAFPSMFSDWQCEVIALDLPRSFWEKATLLHAEYHRPEDQAAPDRYSRHYADVARLLEHPTASTFLADKTLCARVADWKSRVFARRWARYELARHGSFRLAPPARRLEALASDYAVMRPMFLHDPPPFTDVVERLAAAEQAINSM